jgi:nucleoside-diphosphate kinase
MPGSKTERTFIAVKPDGVQRGIVGEIIRRFENKGYKLVGMKLLTPTIEQAQQHYIDLAQKGFYKGLCEYFSSGPICAMCWEGMGVIKGGRTLLGATNPADSLPGTIRGDLCVDVGRNICHGSDGPESAAKEVGFWFKPEELQNYEQGSAKWVYE